MQWGIEKRIFKEKLLAIMATNTLELGVNVGEVRVTLNCGYPRSLGNLVQQAGRGGGGRAKGVILELFI